MKKLFLIRTFCASISFWFVLIAARAQIPQFINYQGRVAVSGTNFDGTGQFMFALVSGSGSETYWSNDGTSVGGIQPANPVSLCVSKGIYAVLLGDVTLPNMTVIPATVFGNTDVRLRVWFNDGAGHGWEQLSPDQRIAAVGYAMVSGSALESGSAATSGSAAQAWMAASGPGGSFGTAAYSPATDFDPAGAAMAFTTGSNTLSGFYNLSGTLSGTGTVTGTNETLAFGPLFKVTALSQSSQAVAAHHPGLLQSQCATSASNYNLNFSMPSEALQSELDIYTYSPTDQPSGAIVSSEFALFSYGNYPLHQDMIAAWAVSSMRTAQVDPGTTITGFDSHIGNHERPVISPTTAIGYDS